MNLDLVSFLLTPEYESIIAENRISIHVGSAEICFGNKNTQESVYSDMYAQTKLWKEINEMNMLKTLIPAFIFPLLLSYLTAINLINVSNYNILTHKNLELLFYQFND